MKLFEPGRIGQLTTKNRIVMPSMGIGGLREPEGRLSQRIIDYYVARARGGTGLIMTSFTMVSRAIEDYPEMSGLGIYDRSYIAKLNELAEAVHDYGTKIAVQLRAGFGLATRFESMRSLGAVGPSALPCFVDPSVIARELTIEEIKQLVEAFGLAAEVISTAGVDAIELDAFGGYLIDQFMTALWNRRTDKYGGDLEGRLRFPLEVIQVIKRRAGSNFPLICRFGLTHYFEGGREVEEGLKIARRLEEVGIDAMNVEGGCHLSAYRRIPTTYMPPGSMVDLAEMTKKVVSIPVIVAGKLGYPELAEQVLQEGKADFIGLGRPLLADPEWPNKVKAGRPEDIRPCMAGNEACVSRVQVGKYISCAVNPATGMEREFAIKPAEKKKSVLVVGGGPAGMEAARVAALRGHKVTLWEKTNALGGNLIPASMPHFKQDYRRLINYLSTQIKKLGVNIELGKEATLELIEAMKPEAVFIATGSVPIVPEIPGIQKGNVVTAVDLLLGRKEAGESAVIIGGGVIGCETALSLTQKGKKPIIIEILESVMRDAFSSNRLHLLNLLADANVKIFTDTKVVQITDKGAIIADKENKRSTLEADTVVLAVGFKPERRLWESLKDKVSEVYAIGDCVEPLKVMNAIWGGFRTARLI